MKQKLTVLELTIPTLNLQTCKQLMGGDDYLSNGTQDDDIAYSVDLPTIDVSAPASGNGFLHEYDQDSNDQDFDDPQDENDPDRDGQNQDSNLPIDIQNVINNLPNSIQEFIKNSGIKIVYDPNYKNLGQGTGSYDSKTDTITIGTENSSILIREIIHAIQDQMGIMDGTSHSAEEFQEKALGDLFDFYNSTFGEGLGMSFTLDGGNSDWADFVDRCFDDNGDFNREFFIDNIMNYFDPFQDAHKDVPGYNDELEDGYQWHWNDFFDMFGL